MNNPPELEVRGRTALGRIALSRPMQRALDDKLLTDRSTVFDYGCGRGGDVDRLTRRGFRCSGWDPRHRPRAERLPADVVNLGYVVNVIEDTVERAHVLRQAFALAREVLVVSARLVGEARDLEGEADSDGVRTSTGTFQRFFTQEELRAWIESTLATGALAAAPGVFYVFRDPILEQAFLARRVRRTVRLAPTSKRLFAEHQEALTPLMTFFDERGRLPRGGELATEAAVCETFGTVRNAWATVRRATSDETWDRIRNTRSADLLVFLALSHLAKRPPRPRELPDELRLDVRDHFGSHKDALKQSARLLLACGDRQAIDRAARSSPVGKCLPKALYVHVDAVGLLVPMLRVTDGLARALVGEIDGATLVKFHLDRPAVSYLCYPDFDSDPHPSLDSGYIVHLDDLRVVFRNYRGHRNPAVLHRKELFLAPNDSRAGRFARLTRQEERAGLYANPSKIGLRQGWLDLVAASGRRHAGHRLLKAESGSDRLTQTVRDFARGFIVSEQRTE